MKVLSRLKIKKVQAGNAFLWEQMFECQNKLKELEKQLKVLYLDWKDLKKGFENGKVSVKDIEQAKQECDNLNKKYTELFSELEHLCLDCNNVYKESDKASEDLMKLYDKFLRPVIHDLLAMTNK